MTDNEILIVFDVAADDFRRTHQAVLAGWLPDVAGEIRAGQMLTEGLDDHQRALLAEMQEWSVE